jgi:hypothetical protein
VAHIAVPQTCRSIEISTALLVEDVGPLPTIDDEFAQGRHRSHVGEGMPQSRARLLSGSRILHRRRLA